MKQNESKDKAVNWKQFEKMKGEVVQTNDANIFRFEEAGQSFIGKYLNSEIINFGQGDPFIAFSFDTEKGIISFSGGVSFESNMRLINKNSIIRVTYIGKVKTATKGRKVNKYTVELLSGSINKEEREKLKKEISERIKSKIKVKK